MNLKFFNLNRIKAFTLIEVVATVGLIGIISTPFFAIFLTGTQYTLDARDDLIALNLARERIEQLKLVPFGELDEDFYIYRDIYRDTIHSDFRGAADDLTLFYKHFNDIWTEKNSQQYPRIFSRFKSIYESSEVLIDYELYPEMYENYRRYTIVENYKSDSSIDMRKICVKVFFEDNLAVELITLRSDYR
ncbi:MAG: type IV pilus modification PilV family protein [Candidatus Muiribacteriota bacterium]